MVALATNALHFLCLYQLISNYIHLPVPVVLTHFPVSFFSTYTHTLSFLSGGVECHLQCGPNVAEKRGQGSRSSVRQNISATCHTERGGPACARGWLASSWMSIKVNAAPYSYIWEYGFQNVSQVTDVSSARNTSQVETAQSRKCCSGCCVTHPTWCLSCISSDQFT